MKFDDILIRNKIIAGGPDEWTAMRNRRWNKAKRNRNKLRCQDNLFKFFIDKYSELMSKDEKDLTAHDIEMMKLHWITAAILYPYYQFREK